MKLTFIAASTSIILAATTSSHTSFPAEFQGSWVESLSSCEPEFTQGFKIRNDKITYYEGADRVIFATPVAAIKTKLGAGQTMVVDLEYSHHKQSMTSSDRFTLVRSKWLYRSDSKMPMSAHLSIKNRTVRCPAESMDG